MIFYILFITVVYCFPMTQADALSIMKMGKNIYLTGGAGSGKTYVLNSYIKYLRDHDINVAITASTGIAATHIGGMTIHAWSGMGIRETLSDWDIESLEEKKYLWDRYDKVQVLIIDEISMLSGKFLDTLDRICRAFKRKPTLSFGGIQVILCGDLFQLPPVTKRDETVSQVIDSDAWKTMGMVMCYLTEQHRQDDEAFTEILNAIRKNAITEYHLEVLNDRLREYDADDFESITKLFTHNADVDSINSEALAGISEEEFIFEMTSKGKENLVESLKKSCLAPVILKLKIGAEVMFVKNNIEAGYVNGTRGTVIDINEMNLPVVKTLAGREVTVDTETWAVEDNGKVLASISQIPLRHAWAITVHKSQGMSLDAAVVDLSKSFAYGMGYVALSRVRTLNGLHLVGFQESSLAVDPRILLVDQQLQQISDRAVERLKDFSNDELKKVHEEFIIKSGGTITVKKGKKAKDLKEKLSNRKTHETTFDMLQAGKNLMQIANERDLQLGTIIEHLQKCKDSGKSLRDFPHLSVDSELLSRVRDAHEALRSDNEVMIDMKLTPIKRYLDKAGYDDSFDDIKLARLFMD